MKDKPKTIEEQIHETIKAGMDIAHEEVKTLIVQTVSTTIDAKVNGKIDAFRKEQGLVNELQNQALQRIGKNTTPVVQFYDGSGKFFRATKIAAVWITAIAGAVLVIWTLFKYLVSRV